MPRSPAPIGNVTPIAQRLLGDHEGLPVFDAVEQRAPGNRLGDVSHAVQTRVESEGFSAVSSLVGHGIGREMHEDPQVPNYPQTGKKGAKLEPGMVIAIEPMVNAGGYPVTVKADKWTIIALDKSNSRPISNTRWPSRRTARASSRPGT